MTIVDGISNETDFLHNFYILFLLAKPQTENNYEYRDRHLVSEIGYKCLGYDVIKQYPKAAISRITIVASAVLVSLVLSRGVFVFIWCDMIW